MSPRFHEYYSFCSHNLGSHDLHTSGAKKHLRDDMGRDGPPSRNTASGELHDAYGYTPVKAPRAPLICSP